MLLRTFYEAGGSHNQQTAEILYAYSHEDLLPFKSAAAVPVPVEAAGEAAAGGARPAAAKLPGADVRSVCGLRTAASASDRTSEE